jgi:Flp pilus assembly protein TadG
MRLITHRLSPPARKPDGTGPAHAPGQALVEFALMLPLLLLLAVGILEFGMLFKDHVGIHYASREGARAGASASRNTTADCSILRAVSTTMQTMPYADLQRVRIFKADNGGVCGTPCAEDVYFRTPSPGNTCLEGWTLERPATWVPNDHPGRRNQEPTDALAVTVQFLHRFFFNYLPSASGTISIEDTSINQIEPERFRPSEP